MIDRRQWYRAVRAEKNLSKTAKAYAEWLTGRRVRNKDDLYKGGQAAAAAALGCAVRTIHTVEQQLVSAGYLKMHERGVRNRTLTVWQLRDPAFNMQKLPVITETKHADGGMFRNEPKHAKTASSMTKPPLRIVRDNRVTAQHHYATANGNESRVPVHSSPLRPFRPARCSPLRRHDSSTGRVGPGHPLAKRGTA